jgi:hypothetical protein
MEGGLSTFPEAKFDVTCFISTDYPTVSHRKIAEKQGGRIFLKKNKKIDNF